MHSCKYALIFAGFAMLFSAQGLAQTTAGTTGSPSSAEINLPFLDTGIGASAAPGATSTAGGSVSGSSNIGATATGLIPATGRAGLATTAATSGVGAGTLSTSGATATAGPATTKTGVSAAVGNASRAGSTGGCVSLSGALGVADLPGGGCIP
jgi:hypothetical protein